MMKIPLLTDRGNLQFTPFVFGFQGEEDEAMNALAGRAYGDRQTFERMHKIPSR